MIKKLPKAIGQTIDDLRRAKPDMRDETKSARVSLASVPSPVPGGRAGDVLAEETRSRRANAEPASAVSSSEKPASVIPISAEASPAKSDNSEDDDSDPEPARFEKPAVESEIEASAAAVIAPVQAASPAVADRDVELHRSQAREIVERHATYSAVGGFVPLPLIEIVSMTAIIHRMVKNLAAHYDVKFDRDRTRAIVAGLIGGLAPLGLGALTTASLVKFIPGANLIGLGVSSMAAAEGTRRIGYIFMAHFEGGGTLLDFRRKPE